MTPGVQILGNPASHTHNYGLPKQRVGRPRPVRLLTFTTLFPHEGRPNHGIFVENRLRHLVASGEAISTVVAPVPWFPSRSARFGDWSRNARAGRVETRDTLTVYHPRYASIPKAGMSVAPAALFAAALPTIRRLEASGAAFDAIDAHYLYPDGVAAVALGRVLRKPVVVTARGSDVTQFPDYRMPRRMIYWAIRHAAALVSVSAGLRDALIELGAPAAKVTVLRNGVDLDLFRPSDPLAARAIWGFGGPMLLSVGHLIARKRHHFAIEALTDLPDWRLAIVGDGPERSALEALSRRLNVSDRVIFCGSQPHSALPGFYSAADLSILASSREGWANVLLESMACGTPVVASRIPGNPEVVTGHAAGVIVEENSAACFAATINSYAANRPTRQATRAYAEQFGWGPTTQGQLELFRHVITSSAR